PPCGGGLRRLGERSDPRVERDRGPSWVGGSAASAARARRAPFCENIALQHPPSQPSPTRGEGAAVRMTALSKLRAGGKAALAQALAAVERDPDSTDTLAL